MISTEWTTTDELFGRICRAGRTNGPMILAEAWAEGEINGDTLAALLGEVWSMAEYPERDLGREEWMEMFEYAGYTEGGIPRTPPEELRLYRGCHPDAKAGMSWSSDITVAERFASGQILGRKSGRLYTALVPGSNLLSYDNERGEHEYVVNTEGLEIVEVSL